MAAASPFLAGSPLTTLGPVSRVRDANDALHAVQSKGLLAATSTTSSHTLLTANFLRIKKNLNAYFLLAQHVTYAHTQRKFMRETGGDQETDETNKAVTQQQRN